MNMQWHVFFRRFTPVTGVLQAPNVGYSDEPDKKTALVYLKKGGRQLARRSENACRLDMILRHVCRIVVL